MKSFLKKKWHRLPVSIITVILLTCLVAGSAFAAINLSEPQTITQVVYESEYGSITIAEPSLVLDDLKIGSASGSLPFENAVTVVIREEGVGQYLHFKIDEASTNLNLYSFFTVSLVCPDDNPMEELLILGVNSNTGPESSIQLTSKGIYTFNETINARALNTAGTAEVKLTITLEDDPYVAP